MEIGKPAHVAGALDIILTAKGIDPGRGFTDLPRCHGQVCQGQDIVRPCRMLGDTHGIENGCIGRLGIEAGCLHDVLGRHTRYLFNSSGV